LEMEKKEEGRRKKERRMKEDFSKLSKFEIF
jgi:hypothetical protein